MVASGIQQKLMNSKLVQPVGLALVLLMCASFLGAKAVAASKDGGPSNEKVIRTECGRFLTYQSDGNLIRPSFVESNPRQKPRSTVFDPNVAVPNWLLEIESPIDVLLRKEVFKPGQPRSVVDEREVLISYMDLLAGHVEDRSSQEAIVAMGPKMINSIVNMITSLESLGLHMPSQVNPLFDEDLRVATRLLVRDSKMFLTNVQVLVEQGKIPKLDSFAHTKLSKGLEDGLSAASANLPEFKRGLDRYRQISEGGVDGRLSSFEIHDGLVSLSEQLLPVMTQVLNQHSLYFLDARFHFNILDYETSRIRNQIRAVDTILDGYHFSHMLGRAQGSFKPDVQAAVEAYNEAVERFRLLAEAFQDSSEVRYLRGHDN